MMTILIGNACLFLEENFAIILGFKGVCITVQYTEFMNDILKTCASQTDLKPRLFWLYIFVLHASAQCSFSL